MHVLIFGGNRYVGRRVATRLLAEGSQVTLVHRSEPSVPGAEVIRGDRADPSIVARALAAHPDVILDMSLYTGVAAHSLLGALAACPVRYVSVSTAAIYSQEAPVPWSESSPVDPAPGWGTYGKGKAAADAKVLAAGLRDTLIVRPVYVIGSGDPDERCARLFSRAADDLPVKIPGEGSAIVQVVEADAMADILIRLLRGEAVGVVDVPGATVSVKSFIEQCVELAGGSGEMHFVARDSKRYLPDEWPFPDLNLWVRGERFKAECSVELTPLEQVLAKVHSDWRT